MLKDMSKRNIRLASVFAFYFLSIASFAYEPNALPYQWTPLNKTINERLNKSETIAKLTPDQVDPLVAYLKAMSARELAPLQKLQKILPKTTLALLFSIQLNKLEKEEAQKIAIYLHKIPNQYHIKNMPLFDENMAKLLSEDRTLSASVSEGQSKDDLIISSEHHHIEFKSVENLKNYLAAESELSRFKKMYQQL